MASGDAELSEQPGGLIAEAWARIQLLPPLHRYISLDEKGTQRFEEFIQGATLHFSPYGKLNDPFEGNAPFTFNAPREAILAHIAKAGIPIGDPRAAQMLAAPDDVAIQDAALDRIREYIASYGVCCFSEPNDDVPMWSYYAGGHTGLCLRFNVSRLRQTFMDTDRGFLIPVAYVQVAGRSYFSLSEIERAWAVVATKAKAWEHEREWRLIIPEMNGLLPCARECLDGIILGCRMDGAVRAWVRGLVAQFRPQVEVFEAFPKRGEYALGVRKLQAR